jgi:p-aminobenzoyl-glutamate transporter AbgT
VGEVLTIKKNFFSVILICCLLIISVKVFVAGGEVQNPVDQKSQNVEEVLLEEGLSSFITHSWSHESLESINHAIDCDHAEQFEEADEC